MLPRRFTIHLSLFTIPLFFAAAVHAQVLASSSFPTDPTAGNPRFTYNPADHTVTAHYNTSQPTTKLLFPLARSLTAGDSFVVTTRFEILSQNFFQDPNGFAQIAFGLVNASSTGNDRSGGIGHDFSAGNLGSSGDTYNLVTFDYFPNLSTFFPTPNLGATIIAAKTGTEPAFADLYSASSSDQALNGPGETPPPFDTFLNATLSYNADTRVAKIQLATDSTPLLLNAGGGPDGDPFTIETALPPGVNFNVDNFALTLWTDSYADSGPSVVADVVFSNFTVAAVPEPATLSLLALATLPLLMRRRR